MDTVKKIADISHYAPVSDWKKVKGSVSFLISKATQGTTYIDPTLDQFIRGCEKYKIPYWLYAYLNNGNELAQAKFLVKTVRKRTGSCFVGYILDVEDGNRAANVKAALDYLKKQGRKTMLYTGYASYGLYRNVIAGRGSRCAWWEARYGTNSGKYNSKYPGHKGADLLQYTSRGSCPGIRGRVDLNRINGKKKLKWFLQDKKGQAKDKAKAKGKAGSKA